MKTIALVACLSLSSVLAHAQSTSDPLSAGIKGIYNISKNDVSRSAEKMPEENYSFQPTAEVRTFGQIIGHVADAQYLFCSAAIGEKNPGLNIEKTKTTKADLVKALNDALAYCDKAYDSMADAHAADMVTFFGQQRAKLAVLAFNAAHNMEHYGNLVTYMRIKGLVPPSSEPRK